MHKMRALEQRLDDTPGSSTGGLTDEALLTQMKQEVRDLRAQVDIAAEELGGSELSSEIAEAKTRRVCAIILHSLASSQVCRADMVAKGAVQVLYMLSSDVDTITLHYIASAIISLSYHEDGREGNVPRLINEGGVTALYNICLRCPKIPSTTQLCASALSLLSLQKIQKYKIHLTP